MLKSMLEKMLPVVLVATLASGAAVKSDNANAGLIQFNPNTAISAECDSPREGISLYNPLTSEIGIGACTVKDDVNSVLVYGNLGENYFDGINNTDLFNGNFFSLPTNYTISTPQNIFSNGSDTLLANDFMNSFELLITKDSNDGYQISDINEGGKIDLGIFDNSFNFQTFLNQPFFQVQVAQANSGNNNSNSVPAPGTLALLLLGGALTYRRRNK